MRLVSAVTALGSAAFTVMTVVPAGLQALLPAMFGLAAIGIGLRRDGRSLVTGGGLALFAGVLVAGLVGIPHGLVLFGTLGSIVSWDAATFGIGLEEQLTPAADSSRAEFVHVGLTVTVGGGIATVAYLALIVGQGRFPPLAAIALVAGAWLLTMGLEPVGGE